MASHRSSRRSSPAPSSPICLRGSRAGRGRRVWSSRCPDTDRPRFVSSSRRLSATGDVDECRQPVEQSEHLVFHCTGLDMPGPTNDLRCSEATFPGLAFLASERRDAAVGEGYRFGTVVGGEDDDRIVSLAHVVELLEDESDLVVHLLHAGFVNAPVFATNSTQHGQVLVRKYGVDVHAGRVVPDEEGLASLFRIVAVEEVDELGRYLLIDCF